MKVALISRSKEKLDQVAGEISESNFFPKLPWRVYK